MNASRTVKEQHSRETSIVGCIYVTIDGMVKYCITAPMLELPIDFKEWYKPVRSNAAQLSQI